MRHLTVFLVCTLASASANVKSKFEKAGIVPNIIHKAPEQKIQIIYKNGTVDFGNELTPTEVKDIPKVHYHHECESFYTLALIDPSVKANGSSTVLDHWLIGNIPGDEVSKGETLTEYIGAGPPKGDKPHRYIFLLYKQPQGVIKFNEPIISKTNINRFGFSIENIVNKYNLTDAVAGNYFTAKYDDYVPKLQRQLGEP